MQSLTALFIPPDRVVGLSFIPGIVRAVQLTDEKKIMVKKEATLPEQYVTEGGIVDKIRVKEVIKGIWDSEGFTSRYLAVTLPESFAFTRAYHVPPIALSEIGEAITWHIHELFPYPVDAIYYDWKLVSSSSTGYDVVVVCIQRKVIDDFMDIFSDLNLHPLRFEPDASALTRLLPKEAASQTLLVELHHTESFVTLVVDGKSLFTTVVTHLNDETSEVYVQHISDSIQEVTDYYSKRGLVQINSMHMLLTGSLASEQWVTYFKNKSFQSVELLPSPIPELTMLKAFAAAAFKIAPPDDPNSINLLPKLVQEFYDKEQNNRLLKALSLRLFIGTCICTIISAFVFGFLTFQRSILDNEITALRINVQSQPIDTKKVLTLNSQAKQIVELFPRKKTPGKYFDAIQERIPQGIKIDEINYDDGKQLFVLRGIAETREKVLDLRSELESESSFGKITVPLATLESPINVPFTITFIIRS